MKRDVEPGGTTAALVSPASLASEIQEAAARPWSVRTLVADLDGTLAPIVDRPEDARVPGEVRDALSRLVRSGWRVAVVSGRPAVEARGLLEVEGLYVFGCHGAEGSWGGRETGGPSLAVRQRLQALEVEAKRLPWHVPGARVEVKPAGIAFHDREVAEEDLDRWRALVEEMLARHDLQGLERLEGKRVLEIRPQGLHKGRVLQRLPRKSMVPFDASLVVVGDDRTDEDLFEALGPRGLSVLVSEADVPTYAKRRLRSPAEVGELLELLAAR